MNTDKIGLKNKRRIWAAAMLSLILPGLGQVYCGRLKRGLVLNFLNILPLPLIIWLFHLSTAPIVIQIALLLSLAGGMVHLLAIFDSAYLAKRAGAEYQLKDYNSFTVYLLLILIVRGCSIASNLYLKEQILEAFIIPKTSNYPTIIPNDRILANKLAYKNSDPKIGDLIIFLNPENRRINFVKRVIAVAGDTIEIRDNQVYVNDQKLPMQKLPQSVLDNIRTEDQGRPLEGDVYEEINGDAKYQILLASSIPQKAEASPYFLRTTVPEHHCFVLGDNRNFSCDSRHFGPVPMATIKGRADYLYYPAKDWSRFGRIQN